VPDEAVREILEQSRKPHFDRLVAENELANALLFRADRRRLLVLTPPPGRHMLQFWRAEKDPGADGHDDATKKEPGENRGHNVLVVYPRES
jgi:hypothetical protein